MGNHGRSCDRMSDKTHSRHSGIRLPLWGLGLLILVAVGLLVGSGVWLYRTVQSVASAWEITDAPQFSVNPQAATPGASAPTVLTSEDAPAEEQTAAAVATWEGTDRVTVLLMGVDQRCDEEGPTRTDSLMLLTVDPVSKTAGILSLPRDLWVQIPGFGVERINQAYYFGEGFEYPGGGPALAEETVEALLGIKIDYYATINFDAFIQIVDLLGGIEVDVAEPIDDPKYPDSCYGFDPFHLEPGPQRLNGEMALKYARTRSTEGGDIDRGNRQQEVVLAVREQVLAQITDLLVQAPVLWRTLQENVHTTMTLDEALRLALLVQEIPSENIRRAIIDYNHVYVAKTPNGQDVLVPIRENVRALRDELFAPPAVPAAVIENLPEKMQSEGARVAVYNGTQVFGLAAETESYLKTKAVNITEVGNADSATYASSQIIEYGDHPYTVQYLVQLMGIPPLNVTKGTKPEGDYDLLVILGNDWRVPSE